MIVINEVEHWREMSIQLNTCRIASSLLGRDALCLLQREGEVMAFD